MFLNQFKFVGGLKITVRYCHCLLKFKIIIQHMTKLIVTGLGHTVILLCQIKCYDIITLLSIVLGELVEPKY